MTNNYYNIFDAFSDIKKALDNSAWSFFSNENDKFKTLTIDLPGVKKDQIELYVEDNNLHVKVKDVLYTYPISFKYGEIKSKLEYGQLIVEIEKINTRKTIKVE